MITPRSTLLFRVAHGSSILLLALCLFASLNACTSATGGEDDDASTGDYAFSEDFERDESALEHDYPNYSYYDYDTAFDIGIGPAGFFETAHTTVFGYFQTKSCADDFFYNTINFIYDANPIDLTECSSATLSFDWGYDDVTTYTDFQIKMSLRYYGVGSDDSATPTGLWTNEFSTSNCVGCSADFGPEHVTYPLDYGCGYEADGIIKISLGQYLYTDQDSSEACSFTGYIGGLLWIDNVTIDLD